MAAAAPPSISTSDPCGFNPAAPPGFDGAVTPGTLMLGMLGKLGRLMLGAVKAGKLGALGMLIAGRLGTLKLGTLGILMLGRTILPVVVGMVGTAVLIPVRTVLVRVPAVPVQVRPILQHPPGTQYRPAVQYAPSPLLQQVEPISMQEVSHTSRPFSRQMEF